MEGTNVLLNDVDELNYVNGQLHTLVDVDRRVLNRKQTVGYIIFDSARDYNIDAHKGFFNESILKISYDLQAKFNFFAGIWDFIDDFLVGAMMEKTRTRWGKFVPHLLTGGVPFALVSTLYWLLPLFFSQEHIEDKEYIPKFLAYAAVNLVIEFFGNVRNVAIEGYLSTITPYPSDRRRLLAVSIYFHNIISRLPDLVMEFTLDFIKNNIVKSAKNKTMSEMIHDSIFFLGPLTALTSGVAFAWYSTVAKERVHQKIERPKLLESLRIVFSHKPVLIYMISNALGSFGTGVTTNDYYRQVLNWTTFETIAGIPSFFFQPIGYANYNKLAARFSTRSLYIIGQIFAKTFYIPLFFYGMFLKNKKGERFFTSRWAMMPVTVVWEIFYATFWGVRSISINEIRNECNDYLEWKCGFRSEAMLSAASTVFTKVPGWINNILQPKYKDWSGYDPDAYLKEDGKQTERAQKWIFAMSTLFPAIIVLSSMIPMLWFNIDKPTRDKMYRELNERRAQTAEKIKVAAENKDSEDNI